VAAKKMMKAEVDVQMPDNIDLREFRAWWDDQAEDIAQRIEQDAKASPAFKDESGRLRKSIKARKIKVDGEEVWIVQARANHAHLVEFGHALVAKDGKSLGHVAPRPFLRPAKEKALSRVIQRFG
jgi:hypothetical protein